MVALPKLAFLEPLCTQVDAISGAGVPSDRPSSLGAENARPASSKRGKAILESL